MSFAELSLNPILIRGLSAMGYVEPTPIQAQAMGPLLEGRDVIALAPTGTGKTASFVSAVAHHLLRDKRARRGQAARVRGLVICPTRELAIQVAAEAEEIVKGSALRVAFAYGGVGLGPQAEAIEQGADLLVATPGRVLELVEADRLTLAYVSHLVLDEADRMFDMGFAPQLEAILERVPRERQTVLFSATMPAAAEELASKRLRKPVRIEVGTHTRVAAHVRQRLLPVEDEAKTRMLLHLLGDASLTGVLVFARTRRRVGWVASALARHGITTASIHGDRTQPQRRRALEQFARGQVRVVVATDVAARGLHLEAVRCVVNYDLPHEPEEFVHRVGRAGHGGALTGAEGVAITFLTPHDRPLWRAIVEAAAIDLPEETLPDFTPSERPARKGPRPSGPDRAGSRATPPRKPGHGPPRGRTPKSSRQYAPPAPGTLKRRKRPGRPVDRREKPGGGVRRGGNSPGG